MCRPLPPPGLVECDSCDGYGSSGFDETGRPYACYRCGCTGWMPESALWNEPQILAELRNPQPHFLARYPSPPQFYLTGRPAWMDADDEIPF